MLFSGGMSLLFRLRPTHKMMEHFADKIHEKSDRSKGSILEMRRNLAYCLSRKPQLLASMSVFLYTLKVIYSYEYET